MSGPALGEVRVRMEGGDSLLNRVKALCELRGSVSEVWPRGHPAGRGVGGGRGVVGVGSLWSVQVR
jgi:hypothetical protein